MSVVTSLLVFFVVITVVVVIHEGGHFWVGRWCGVRAKTFSVGFGPSFCSWVSSRGCAFLLSVFPLGGYVEFVEEKRNSPQLPPDRGVFSLALISYNGTLSQTPPLGKLCVALAGPAANILLAWLLLAGALFVQGQEVRSAIVGSFPSPSPAQEAGLLVGDHIHALNQKPVSDFQDLIAILSQSAPGSTVMLYFSRNGQDQEQTLPVVLGSRQGHGYLGIMPKASLEKKTLGIPESLWEALKEVGFLSKRTGLYLFGAVRSASFPSDMMGPVGIAHLSGKIYQGEGISGIIWLTVMISLGLGLFNLLPLPVLDGGHVLYALLEWVTGRNIPSWAEIFLQWFGICLLVGLLLMVTYSDVMRMIGL